jgi:hypothetical protein
MNNRSDSPADVEAARYRVLNGTATLIMGPKPGTSQLVHDDGMPELVSTNKKVAG